MNKYYKHLTAIAIFALLAGIFFYPVFLGKQLMSNDGATSIGAAKELNDYYKKYPDAEALWTNSLFGGMPAYQITGPENNTILTPIQYFIHGVLPYPFNVLFLGMVCAYLLFILLGISYWLSIMGAFAIAFSSYNIIIIEAGHYIKTFAIAYSSLLLLATLVTFNKNRWLGAGLFALAVYFQIGSNHPQISYYIFIILLLIGIVEFYFAWRNKQFSRFFTASVLLVFSGLLALTGNAKLLLTNEYMSSTTRGGSELAISKNTSQGLDIAYATNWSYGKMETFNLFIPDFTGRSSGSALNDNSAFGKLLKQYGLNKQQAKAYLQHAPTYYGTQPFTSGPVYMGAIVVFLFVLGLFTYRGKVLYWLIPATVLSILLAWGHHFMWFTELFFYYFPLYNKFRAVSMILVIAQFTLPILGVLTLQKIALNQISGEKLKKGLLYATSIVGGIAAIFAILGPSLIDFSGENDAQIQKEIIGAIIEDRKSMLSSDAFRSLFLVLLAAAGIWAFMQKIIKQFNHLALALAILVLFDLWMVDKRFLTADNFESIKKIQNPYEATAADLAILQDTSYYRVFNTSVGNPFSDASTSFFHKSIGGYHGAKLSRYQDLIDYHLSRGNQKVFDMLNTKYFIVKNNNGEIIPQINPNALGNVWLVSEIRLVNDPQEANAALANFEPAKTAIVEQRFANQLHDFSYDPLGRIRLTTYHPHELYYDFEATKEQLAVFSEIYYQLGWNAYIDGRLTDHFSVNYVLRALFIPAGKHQIVFKFEPKTYQISKLITQIGAVLLLIWLMVCFYLYYKTRNNTIS